MKSLKLKFPWEKNGSSWPKNPWFRLLKANSQGLVKQSISDVPNPSPPNDGSPSEENAVLWTQQSQWSGSSRPQRDTGILHWRWGRRGGNNCFFCFFPHVFHSFFGLWGEIEAKQMWNTCLEHKTAECSTCSSQSFIKFCYHSPGQQKQAVAFQ